MKTMNELMITYFENQIAEQTRLFKEENAKERPDGHQLAAYSGAIRQLEIILKKLKKKEGQ